MGLGDQPDLGDDRWRCAKCNRVSGMYGCLPNCASVELDELRKFRDSFNGPECKDAECLDYDGAHPFHQNALEKAHNAAQEEILPDLREAQAEVKHWKDAYAQLYGHFSQQGDHYIKLRKELDNSVSREKALDALFHMANWQHGYGQSRLATTADCIRCLDYE